MPPKTKKPQPKRIELEPEQPELYEEDEETNTPAPTPKINMTMEKKSSAGRPAGTKDQKPRKMTMSKLEALAKAQAVRKANIERRKKEQQGEPVEPEQAEQESHDEIIERIPEQRQYKQKEESLNTQKSQPIKKPKRKIVIVKEPESDSEESVEIKYIKPKTKPRKREVSYDDYDDYEERPKPRREENALDLLLKHYGGF